MSEGFETIEGCRCEHCDPNDFMAGKCRMHLCEFCGNKRCPHAEWHGYQCTGSNELGQVPTLANHADEPRDQSGEPITVSHPLGGRIPVIAKPDQHGWCCINAADDDEVHLTVNGNWACPPAPMDDLFFYGPPEKAKAFIAMLTKHWHPAPSSEPAELRAKYDKLYAACTRAEMAVMQTSGDWSLHDVSERGKELEQQTLEIVNKNVDLEHERRQSHTVACNHRDQAIGGPGCVCVVVHRNDQLPVSAEHAAALEACQKSENAELRAEVERMREEVSYLLQVIDNNTLAASEMSMTLTAKLAAVERERDEAREALATVVKRIEQTAALAQGDADNAE